MLNDRQIKKVIDIWTDYSNSDKKYKNANTITDGNEINQERHVIMTELNNEINGYINGYLELEDFKSQVDSINKRHRLWGFKGMNGQMFFNMIYNASSQFGKRDDFDDMLKMIISQPNDINEAKEKISTLEDLVDSLKQQISNKKAAPKKGSINFFLSYFWQLQNHEKWPVYYKSMIELFEDEGIWNPSNNIMQTYEEYYSLNHEICEILKEHTNKSISLWDIEHAFWYVNNREDIMEDEIEKATITDTCKEAKTTSDEIQINNDEFSNSYIPPVVAMLPLLAKNTEEMNEICAKMGNSVEKLFEEKISIVFKMLGYSVELKGQGYGRVPDGVAICHEYGYALIFDAKVRQDGYRVGRDDRAIKEYINRETQTLKKQGIRNVYFVIVSSDFKGDFDDVIRNIKIETDARELVFLEAKGLLTILEQRLRNPEIDLGPSGIQNLFVQSGILTNKDVKEFLEN